MKKRFKQMIAFGLITTMILSMSGCSGKKDTGKQEDKFEAKLDTKKETNLQIAGFMANFEALDQVVNDFNQIYPNVTITYEQNNPYRLRDYMKNNKGVDIIMTTDDGVRDTTEKENYVGDLCVDLSKEDIDTSAIEDSMLSYCKIDEQLLRIPTMGNPCGIVVNKTLLKKEGLSVPKNYKEFMSVLKALKEKGYTPIEGAANHLYAELVMNMAMNEYKTDKKADQTFERLEEIIKAGYTDYKVNKEYPEDNYDLAIMKFFEGKVPFWVCNAESFSGMKKRESKSETYSKNSFQYEFMYAPMGEKGSYVYTEPWYGFSVSKNSKNKKYAIEFMRFLATKKELSTMAEIKGMPTVVKNGTDKRYPAIHSIKNVEATFNNDGTVGNHVREAFTKISTDFGAGKYKTAKEAIKAFNKACEK